MNWRTNSNNEITTKQKNALQSTTMLKITESQKSSFSRTKIARNDVTLLNAKLENQ